MIIIHDTIWRFAILIVLAIEVCRGLSTLATKLPSKSILVIGGTGRVGRAIVPKLVDEGFSVRVLCRDIEKAKTFQELTGAELVVGDVGDVESLVSATAGCATVLDVHGVKPLRFAKITDLFTHPRDIPGHPYQVNYLGVKRILAAMEISKCQKIVRITGGIVGVSAFNPFRVLFNSLLSFSSKWHEASEIAIRSSGFDYTIIRPTEIVNEPPLVSYDTLPIISVFAYFDRFYLTNFDLLSIMMIMMSSDRIIHGSSSLCSADSY